MNFVLLAPSYSIFSFLSFLFCLFYRVVFVSEWPEIIRGRGFCEISVDLPLFPSFNLLILEFTMSTGVPFFQIAKDPESRKPKPSLNQFAQTPALRALVGPAEINDKILKKASEFGEIRTDSVAVNKSDHEAYKRAFYEGDPEAVTKQVTSQLEAKFKGVIEANVHFRVVIDEMGNNIASLKEQVAALDTKIVGYAQVTATFAADAAEGTKQKIRDAHLWSFVEEAEDLCHH